MTTKPEPSEAEPQNTNAEAITEGELIAELKEMHGEATLDIAQARVIIRRQQSMITQLQNELIKKAGDAGGTS